MCRPTWRMGNVHTQTPPNAVKHVMGRATSGEQGLQGDGGMGNGFRHAFPGVVLRGGISVFFCLFLVFQFWPKMSNALSLSPAPSATLWHETNLTFPSRAHKQPNNKQTNKRTHARARTNLQTHLRIHRAIERACERDRDGEMGQREREREWEGKGSIASAGDVCVRLTNVRTIHLWYQWNIKSYR